MPIYISRGRFTTDAIKGMMAKPKIARKPSPTFSRASEANSSVGT